MDLVNLIVFFVTFTLRMVTWAIHYPVIGNRWLVIAQYLYALNAGILTLRVLGNLLETNKETGTTHIALVRIVEDVAVIFVQFVVAILAFSLAMAKVLVAEFSFVGGDQAVSRGKGFVLFSVSLTLVINLSGRLFLRPSIYFLMSTVLIAEFFLAKRNHQSHKYAIIFAVFFLSRICSGNGFSW